MRNKRASLRRNSCNAFNGADDEAVIHTGLRDISLLKQLGTFARGQQCMRFRISEKTAHLRIFNLTLLKGAFLAPDVKYI